MRPNHNTDHVDKLQSQSAKKTGSSAGKPHFSREFIDEILARVNMMEIMRSYGVQVKAGAGMNHYYVASFCCGKKDFDNGRIKKATQTYLCEACGEGGNAIHFLRNVAGMSFHEAVEELARIVGLDLPVVDQEQAVFQKRKQEALQLAADFYHSQNNYEYLLSRGISLDVLKKYKAGYAPGGRALRDYLESKGFTKKELSDFKLINQKGLDKFYFRAVIPIIMFGKVVDLYGRSTDDSKNGIKHLYLYGDIPFLGGYDFIQKEQSVTVYESFIDQLVAESNGMLNGTNPGGASKFTAEHARLLSKKKTPRAVFIFDGDQAGMTGSYNAGQLVENEDIDVYVGMLPEKQDPAQVISEKGKEEFLKALKGKPYRKYKLFYELQQYSVEEIEECLHEMKQAKLGFVLT